MLKPIDARVVIEKTERESQTSGGIILPDTAQEAPDTGIVVAIGPGSRSFTGELIPMSIKVGDKVLFARFAAHEIEHQGKKVLILMEKDIMAVVVEEE